MDPVLIGLMLLAALASAAPAVCAKYYCQKREMIYLIIAFLSSLVLIYTYVKLFDTQDLSILYPMLKGLSVIFTALIGIMIFQERMTGRMCLGILFALLAFVILAE